ncbi:hypothetical protein GCM10009681_46200 [Luedemannella helvata]|uniref:R3H domain-containing protein n=1 Tax=Luedemannella helvata TaxID=349315 RepID=A0ABP4X4L2_9ACTN
MSETTNASPADNADEIEAAAGAGPAVDRDDEIEEVELGSESDEEPEDEEPEDEESEDGDEEEERAPSENDLFRESEIAADYIEGLLDILDYDGDIDEMVQSGRPLVEVVGSGLQNLVGSRGSTLEALQELSRLAIYRQTGSPSRLLLDVGGFRATRRKELTAVAKNAAERVKEHGDPVRLEPMSAFERKCVHDVINAMSGVESESEGVEPSRRIVVRRSN